MRQNKRRCPQRCEFNHMELTADIHEKYYSSLGADDALYYKIRHEIMHAMLEETQLTLTVDGDTYTLSC